MPSYKGVLTQQEQLLSRFVVNSPFRDDPDPPVIDRATIVTCHECNRRFLDSDWLDKHLADGHVRADDPALDIELALSRDNGAPLSPYQVFAKDILARVKSGDLRPGSRFALNELARYYLTSSHTISKAVALLVEHGCITRTGTGSNSIWTIAVNDESQDDS